MDLQIENGATHINAAHLNIHSYAKRRTRNEECLEYSSPAAFSLDANGFILECDRSVETLFGYSQLELVWQHISCLFPKLAEVALIQSGRLNPMLNFICHCDHIFEAIDRQSGIVTCNLTFLLVENKGTQNLRLIVRPVAAANA
ncbi:MAG TPA: PAS domain-containing protein [Sideroxyarcus sp.]|nr:PAS domain-containing protein [Sideroxyarcus sp.]